MAKAVERASQAFTEKNLRFTKLRQDVFQEIASTYTSIGAYDVLARLAEKGTRLAPISVYRAIDALIEAGVIHRLESKNAYFACRKLDHATGRPPDLPVLREVQRRAGGRLGGHLRYDRPRVARRLVPAAREVRGGLGPVPLLRFEEGLKGLWPIP